nr:hypothetical protein [Bacteroidales bacterium]
MSLLRHAILILLLISAGFSQRLIGQSAEANLINSTYGLSNNDIHDIYQDSYGYLWFATSDGLNRFDGYDYVVYRPGMSDSTSIASGFVYTIEEDNSGNIWVGTDRGLSKCNINTNSFENIDFYHEVPGENRNLISDLVFSNDTTLW